MSSLPKWINDAVENVLSSKFRECTIIKTENISDRLRKIQFKTNLENLYFEPAYAIGIRINERDFRNYSPFNFNEKEGCFDVLFHLHDKTASGCHFINSLSDSGSLKVLIPRGKRFFANEAKIHFSIGDETSLGTSISIKEAAEKINTSFLCLHEIDQPESLEILGLFGYYVEKNNPLKMIETLTEFLREEKKAIYNDEVVFYLTGNGQTMSLIRKFLKASGVSAKCIRSQAYWIEGKKGL
ncbi:iron transporter [Chryseobacterium sp. JUb7]|uniref:iron transporter n=1 Tax=Chryseobacterium sp. JUb7 TaxID=2940599 RepID=UPI002168B2BD|nr:iron transporter [Chryseobacterium sp. JUb7]MCS3528663.1 NADPH-dependent ferric siderophore reductase [Chryseobacterium sp. JUb7]